MRRALDFQPRPDSEIEWEDLLMRLEIMPRALSVLLEEVDPESSGAGEVLRDLLDAESLTRGFLERAASLPALPLPEMSPDASASARMERFVRLRARNFAMVQRRGIEVWGWSADLKDGGSATVHQLLRAVAERDSEALATIRRLARTGTVVC